MSQERGFASMSEEERRRISEKGGDEVSKDREHMSEIGRKGGESSGGGDRGDDRGGNQGGGNQGGNRGGGNR